MARKGSRSATKQQKKNRDRLDSFIKQIDSELIGILMGESDRGCVLVAAGFIEEGLEHFLRRYLFSVASDNADAEWLLTERPQAALGTFHARIVACSAFGLIKNPFRQALMDLKQMRNTFAHRDPQTPAPSLTEEDGLRLLRQFKGDFSQGDVTKVFVVIREVIAQQIMVRGSATLKGIESQFVSLPKDFQSTYMDNFVASDSARLWLRVPFLCFVLLALQKIQVAHSLENL